MILFPIMAGVKNQKNQNNQKKIKEFDNFDSWNKIMGGDTQTQKRGHTSDGRNYM